MPAHCAIGGIRRPLAARLPAGCILPSKEPRFVVLSAALEAL